MVIGGKLGHCTEYVTAILIEGYPEAIAVLIPFEALEVLELLQIMELDDIAHVLGHVGHIDHAGVEFEGIAYIQPLFIVYGNGHILVAGENNVMCHYMDGDINRRNLMCAVHIGSEAIGDLAGIAGHVVHMQLHAQFAVVTVAEIQIGNRIIGQAFLTPFDPAVVIEVEVCKVQVANVILIIGISNHVIVVDMLINSCVIAHLDKHRLSNGIVVGAEADIEAVQTRLIEGNLEASDAILGEPGKALLIPDRAGRIHLLALRDAIRTTACIFVEAEVAEHEPELFVHAHVVHLLNVDNEIQFILAGHIRQRHGEFAADDHFIARHSSHIEPVIAADIADLSRRNECIVVVGLGILLRSIQFYGQVVVFLCRLQNPLNIAARGRDVIGNLYRGNPKIALILVHHAGIVAPVDLFVGHSVADQNGDILTDPVVVGELDCHAEYVAAILSESHAEADSLPVAEVFEVFALLDLFHLMEFDNIIGVFGQIDSHHIRGEFEVAAYGQFIFVLIQAHLAVIGSFFGKLRNMEGKFFEQINTVDDAAHSIGNVACKAPEIGQAQNSAIAARAIRPEDLHIVHEIDVECRLSLGRRKLLSIPFYLIAADVVVILQPHERQRHILAAIALNKVDVIKGYIACQRNTLADSDGDELAHNIVIGNSYDCAEAVHTLFVQLDSEAIVVPLELSRFLKHMRFIRIKGPVAQIIGQIDRIEFDPLIVEFKGIAGFDIKVVDSVLFVVTVEGIQRYSLVARHVLGGFNKVEREFLMPVVLLILINGEAVSRLACAGNFADIDAYAEGVVIVAFLVHIHVRDGIFRDRVHIPCKVFAASEVPVLHIGIAYPLAVAFVLCKVFPHNDGLSGEVSFKPAAVIADDYGDTPVNRIVVGAHDYPECIAAGLVERYAEAENAVLIFSPVEALLILYATGNVHLLDDACALGNRACLSEIEVCGGIEEFLAHCYLVHILLEVNL